MSAMKWKDIYYGPLKREDIKKCISDKKWQAFRRGLKNTMLRAKYRYLRRWLILHNYSHCAKVQVTNYINALIRGGLVDRLDVQKPKK